MTDLQARFGNIDIYLFDQLLRGRIEPDMRILDAGCGGGRNLVYMLQAGYETYGVDADPAAIASVRGMLPRELRDRFRQEPVEAMSFPDGFADVVISSAVVHFARDDRHFSAMLVEMWRVLRAGGLFFCRLASTIGLEGRVEWISGRRGRLPDGSERYLVDAALLEKLTEELGGTMLDPLKTTIVQDQRAMTTWVARKGTGPFRIG